MLRRLGLVMAAGIFWLVGCQQYDPVAYVPPPALQPPAIAAPPQRHYQPQHPPGQPPNVAPPVYRPPYRAPSSPAPHAWAPTAPAKIWKYIVIHHSDTRVGSAASFDRYHRQVNHWDELGYHFVIGNGSGSGNGQVEVGPRWMKQKWGAHAGNHEFNEYGIGICLVGDFEVQYPSGQQMQSLTQLVAYLMRAHHIPPQNVIGHRDCRKTNCPGRHMDVSSIRRHAAMLAAAQPGLEPLARR